jgi:hypothetical protein
MPHRGMLNNYQEFFSGIGRSVWRRKPLKFALTTSVDAIETEVVLWAEKCAKLWFARARINRGRSSMLGQSLHRSGGNASH